MQTSNVNSNDIDDLRARLEEAEELLQAIRNGSVDALVVSGAQGERVYTLHGAEHTYRLMVETMDQGAAALSEDGSILYCNRRLADMVHSESEAMVNMAAGDLMAPEDRGRFAELFMQACPDATAKAEMRLASDQRRLVLISLNELFIGDVRNVCMLVTDLSEQKRTEKALATQNAELKKRADQLSRLSCELTMTEQRERKQVAVLLHDGLQQYLAAAKMQLGLITENSALGHDVRQTAQEIEKLLVESLSMTRSLSADLSPPALKVGGLAAALVWLSHWMKEKYRVEVNLSVGGDAQLPEDVKVMVFQSVRELLFNAVKHAGVFSVLVQLRQIPQGGIQVIVSDEGIGFDPGRLYMEDTANKGFGLFSIQERIGLIGGQFEMQSAPGKGSRFTLTVPSGLTEKSGSRPQLQPQAQQHRSEGKTIRVLLVDDFRVTRQLLVKMIDHKDGIQLVGQADSGQAAIEQVRQLMPDVVVMDFSIPGMDGVEATRRIKAEMPGVRVIGLSMHEDERLARAMLEAGAEAFISKSATSAELLKAIYGIVCK